MQLTPGLLHLHASQAKYQAKYSITALPYLTWRPGHLASTHNMDMNVVHLLSSIFAIIDHYAIPLSQVLFGGNFSSNYEEMAQQLKKQRK